MSCRHLQLGEKHNHVVNHSFQPASSRYREAAKAHGNMDQLLKGNFSTNASSHTWMVFYTWPSLVLVFFTGYFSHHFFLRDKHVTVVRNTFLCPCALHLCVAAEEADAVLGIQDINKLGCFAIEPKLGSVSSRPLPHFPCDLAQTTINYFF